MRRLASAAVAILVAAAIVAPLSARADTAADYNLFVLGDINVHSGDTQGRIAAKGDTSLVSYSVGAAAPANTANLVVGGNLSAHNGSTNGQTIVGGTTDYQSWSSAGLQAPGTASPVNFAAETTRLDTLSALLKGVAANGAVSTPWTGQYSLTGTNAALNVFDLDGSLLAHTNSLVINLAAGSKALINVSGTADSFSNAGITIIGGDASDILWNFADATSLTFSGISMLGSVLAPNADYLGGWGQLNGQLIVKSFSDANGSTQINSTFYSGDLLRPGSTLGNLVNPVPEPATWALMIVGFGGTGMMLRRRRAELRLVPIRVQRKL